MGDSLGDRMKQQYEDRTRYFLPRRSYTIIRLDGKAFHTFTANAKKPYDLDLIRMMDETAKKLCKELQGAKLAYVQSDEISILLTDFETPTTCAWFDGNVQKIASVAASIATAKFNRMLFTMDSKDRERFGRDCALFDARVFTIPDPVEVENYFIWRQQDWTRNSVQMAAQALYSHKELHGKNTPQMHDMMMAKGVNWANYDSWFKNGRVIKKIEVDDGNYISTHRSMWLIDAAPVFTQEREFLKGVIPRQWAEDAAG